MAVEPAGVKSVNRLEYPDGSGEVRITFLLEDRSYGNQLPLHLSGIADVRRVADLFRSVLIGRDGPVRPDRDSHPAAPHLASEPDDFEEPF